MADAAGNANTGAATAETGVVAPPPPAVTADANVATVAPTPPTGPVGGPGRTTMPRGGGLGPAHGSTAGSGVAPGSLRDRNNSAVADRGSSGGGVLRAVPTVITAQVSRRQLLVGVVFTLDDTLFDSTGRLAAPAYEALVQSLSTSLPELQGLDADDAVERANLVVKGYMSSVGASRRLNDLVEDLVREGRLTNEQATAAMDAYYAGSMSAVDSIEPFPDTAYTLNKLRKRGYMLGLLTRGNEALQRAKIKKLGLEPLFDAIVVSTFPNTKKALRAIAKQLGVRIAQKTPNDADVALTKPSAATPPGVPLVVVGNKIMSEICAANRMGFVTVRVQQGHYGRVLPAFADETPDYTIARLSSVLGVMDVAERARVPAPRITTIGGGTGMPLVLRALSRLNVELSAVVTVFDSGRSSGVMRRELGILPPGDVRNCLVALSDREDDVLKQVMNYRFTSLATGGDGAESEGTLHGTSCGNLILAALTKLTGGSFSEAVRVLSSLLGIEGTVIPVTATDTHLKATLADGSTRVSEVEVRKPGKPHIVKLELENSAATADPAAVKAVLEADGIIMGPGSFYTSVLATLLPRGMCTAVASAKGLRVYVANLTAQAGQTDGMTLRQHVVMLERYLRREGVPQLSSPRHSTPQAGTAATGAGAGAGTGAGAGAATAAAGEGAEYDGAAGAGATAVVTVVDHDPSFPVAFRCLDVVVANNRDPGPEVMRRYMEKGVTMLLPQAGDAEWFAERGLELVACDLIDTAPKEAEFAKALMPTHDITRIAQVLEQLCRPSAARRMKAAARLVASAKLAVEGEGPAARVVGTAP